MYKLLGVTSLYVRSGAFFTSIRLLAYALPLHIWYAPGRKLDAVGSSLELPHHPPARKSGSSKRCTSRCDFRKGSGSKGGDRKGAGRKSRASASPRNPASKWALAPQAALFVVVNYAPKSSA